jgi:hypothetical protein
MIKDIMVHLDGSAEDEIRLAYAEIIASTWGAHLTAIFTNRLPDLAVATPVDGGAAMMQMLSEWQNQAQQEGTPSADALPDGSPELLSRASYAGSTKLSTTWPRPSKSRRDAPIFSSPRVPIRNPVDRPGAVSSKPCFSAADVPFCCFRLGIPHGDRFEPFSSPGTTAIRRHAPYAKA